MLLHKVKPNFSGFSLANWARRVPIALALLAVFIYTAYALVVNLSGRSAGAITATTISPNSGLTAGGQTVTITGTGFPTDLIPGGAETKTLPNNMVRYTSHLYNGKIYMPDSSGDKLEVYNIATGTTETKTRPFGLTRFTSQLYNGKLYMPDAYDDRLEIYDIATDTTIIKTLLDNNMQRFTSQLYNGKLYMPDAYDNQLEIYDIATDTAETKTLPNWMDHFTSQLYNGKLYMPGGGGNILEIYDIATDTTETKTLPNNMERWTSQISGGKLYMPQRLGTALEIYDIATGTTETKTLPSSMWRSTSQLYNGKLYMPEYDGNKLEIYDIATGTTITKTLPNSMERYTSQIYNGKLYLPEYSGDKLEIYDLRELSVTFDGTPATNATIVNSTTITATTPAHAVGTVDVVVSTGVDTAALPGAYTYAVPPPTVSAISPDNGPVIGGQTVTITGSNFPTGLIPGGLEVKTSLDSSGGLRRTSQISGGKLYMPQDSGNKLEIYDIANDTTATKTLPNNMNRMTSQIHNGKLYMPQNGGNKLEIYDIATDTTVTKTLPNNMGRYTSQIFNGKLYMPGFVSGKLEIYDIATGTTETKTLPNNNVRYYTSQIHNGKLYMPGYEDSGSRLEIYDIATDTTETKILPNGMGRLTSQIYNGKLYMPGESGDKLEIYDIATDTTITEIPPYSFGRFTSQLYNGKLYMPDTHDDRLTIYDLRELSVTFDDIPATDVTVINDTTLTAVTPAHAVGAVDVAVSLNDDTATLSGGYTYSLTATSITPSTGPVAGGTNVTIAGSNFPADFVPGGAETKTLTSTTNYITSQVYGGKLYMPGESGNKLVIYDVAADTTTTKTLPNNMNRYTAQIYNGKLYMPENNGTKLEVYDIATGTTETRYTLNTMDRVTSQLYGGKLYMPERNGNQLAIYNITAGGYNNTVITLPNNMYHSTSQVYNGKLYMPENNGTKLEIYDIATNTTTTETLLNTMFRLTSQLSGGKLYMPGGTNNKLEIYDIATGTTETKTLPNSMLRNTSQLYNGKIYMPEYDGNKLEIYDITTGTTITKTLPNSMERWASDLYDGKLYMSEPGSDQLEIFDLRELSVSFDGVPATNIAVVSSTTLTAITPAHAAGVVDVTVSLNGQLATLSGGYTYIPPLAVNSVTPNHGLELGGTSVTVIGTGFIPLPPPTPTTMQEMTQAFCANMTVYTGSNPAAILTLNDPRGAGQQYQIAKLADNNCWMLNNLKLGSTSGTLALTPADTNIATNRTMPQVRGPSDFSSAMDTPWAASVPGDSSSITANNFYGYHYNWCAATGGDPATCTASGTEPPNATQDICPANWRLPTGGPSGEFAWLNAKMNNVNASAPSTAGGTGYYQNWLNSGRFKGVFSGHGSGGAPNTVGTVGRLWSSTPYNANNVYYLSIEATTVNPANNVSRSVRTAMRCITPGGTAPEPVVEFDGVAATVTAWDETSITVTVPAHAAGLVDVTVNNGAESVTMPATCSTATATDCNGRLDSGETRHSDRANVTSGFLYEEVYLSLSTGTGTVNVGGITPTSGGAYGTSSNLLTTTTNNTTGYSLSISTNQPGANPNSKDLKHLTLNEYITGTANTCSWNTGAGTLTNTTNALVNNTWGFTLNTVNRDNQQLCQVPNSDSPLTIKATNTANESGDNTSVHYGARVSTSKVSGTYQGVIRYVVVARP